MLKRTICVSILLAVLAAAAGANGLQPTIIEQELARTRFGLVDQTGLDQPLYAAMAEEDQPLSAFAESDVAGVDYKSPSRAFVYSMLLPGAGQYYYGSKIKPVVFLATEAVGWAFALKYHGEGEDATDAYEAFSGDHWYRDRYETFLASNYWGSTDPIKDFPDSGIVWKELTETLPDTETQQYFEMTGKYDQFSWGWDDALDTAGHAWDHLDTTAPVPPRVTDAGSTPFSINRVAYEDMRDDANSKYNKSMRFVFVIMANHLISGFEAYFATKKHNNRMRHEEEFARFGIDADVRSYSSWKDTPYVTLSYKF
jgi:hypothetical protein